MASPMLYTIASIWLLIVCSFFFACDAKLTPPKLSFQSGSVSENIKSVLASRTTAALPTVAAKISTKTRATINSTSIIATGASERHNDERLTGGISWFTTVNPEDNMRVLAPRGVMIAGALAKSISATAVHPFNVIKTVLQRQKIMPPLTWKVLTRGAGAQFLISLPHGAVMFAATEYVKFALTEHFSNSTRLRKALPINFIDPLFDFVACSVAAVVCAAISTPQMVITDNIMAGVYPDLFSAVRIIMQSRGIAGFYTGWIANLAQKLPSYALTWVLFQQMKRTMTLYRRQQTTGTDTLFGALSAAIACSAMIPIDTAKVRLVTTSISKMGSNGLLEEQPYYTGMWNCMQRTVQEEGLASLYRPLPFRLLGVVPMVAIQCGAYAITSGMLIWFDIMKAGQRPRLAPTAETIMSSTTMTKRTGGAGGEMAGLVEGTAIESSWWPLFKRKNEQNTNSTTSIGSKSKNRNRNGNKRRVKVGYSGRQGNAWLHYGGEIHFNTAAATTSTTSTTTAAASTSTGACIDTASSSAAAAAKDSTTNLFRLHRPFSSRIARMSAVIRGKSIANRVKDITGTKVAGLLHSINIYNCNYMKQQPSEPKEQQQQQGQKVKNREYFPKMSAVGRSYPQYRYGGGATAASRCFVGVSNSRVSASSSGSSGISSSNLIGNGKCPVGGEFSSSSSTSSLSSSSASLSNSSISSSSSSSGGGEALKQQQGVVKSVLNMCKRVTVAPFSVTSHLVKGAAGTAKTAAAYSVKSLHAVTRLFGAGTRTSMHNDNIISIKSSSSSSNSNSGYSVEAKDEKKRKNDDTSYRKSSKCRPYYYGGGGCGMYTPSPLKIMRWRNVAGTGTPSPMFPPPTHKKKDGETGSRSHSCNSSSRSSSSGGGGRRRRSSTASKYVETVIHSGVGTSSISNPPPPPPPPQWRIPPAMKSVVSFIEKSAAHVFNGTTIE